MEVSPITSLVDCFANVKDPGIERCRRHILIYFARLEMKLFLCVFAVYKKAFSPQRLEINKS